MGQRAVRFLRRFARVGLSPATRKKKQRPGPLLNRAADVDQTFRIVRRVALFPAYLPQPHGAVQFGLGQQGTGQQTCTGTSLQITRGQQRVTV